jgi:hypothetical protein
VWFIEGDIAACFASLAHQIVLATLAEKIHDHRFLRLVAHLLKAGYLADWRYHPTPSGVPQGAVARPILSNVYLNRLDQFVATVLLPQYNRGARRKAHPAYVHLQHQAYRLEHAGQYRAARPLRQRQWAMPSSDTHAPDCRRLPYVRYGDAFLFGFAGTRAEAAVIKAQLTTFLRDTLKLELSVAKTLITHARTPAAHCLGYELRVLHRDQRRTARKGTAKHVTRAINGLVALRGPAPVLREHCARYRAHGKPIHRNGLTTTRTARSSRPTRRSTEAWWSTTNWLTTATPSTACGGSWRRRDCARWPGNTGRAWSNSGNVTGPGCRRPTAHDKACKSWWNGRRGRSHWWPPGAALRCNGASAPSS